MIDGGIDASLAGALGSVGRGGARESSLKYVGDARGLVRGRVETEDAFAERLRKWRQELRLQGSQEGLAKQVQAYVGPVRVRVINRAGRWTTIEPDGTIVRHYPAFAFDWDSVSNPEREDFWSEQWIVVYSPPYAQRPNTFGDGIALGDEALGIGMLSPSLENDTLRKVIAQWKSAHSFVRALIWCTDSSLFDPLVPVTWPNGEWGQWHIGTGVSDRDLSACRYWEFSQT